MNQLSPEKIKLIEKKAEQCIDFTVNGSDQTANMRKVLRLFAVDCLTDPEILLSIKGSEWMSVEDARKMICSAYNEGMYDMNRGSQGNPCHYESGTDYAIKILPIPSKPLNQ